MVGVHLQRIPGEAAGRRRARQDLMPSGAGRAARTFQLQIESYVLQAGPFELAASAKRCWTRRTPLRPTGSTMPATGDLNPCSERPWANPEPRLAGRRGPVCKLILCVRCQSAPLLSSGRQLPTQIKSSAITSFPTIVTCGYKPTSRSQEETGTCLRARLLPRPARLSRPPAPAGGLLPYSSRLHSL